MSWQEIKHAIEENGKAFEAFKETNDERIKAIEDGNDSLAKELDQKLDKIEKDITAASKIKKDLEVEMEIQRERIEELESRAKSPAKTKEQKLKEEHKDAFVNWIRSRGKDTQRELKMQELQQKDVTIGSNAGGGFAVPEEISRDIERLEKKFSPVRRLVKVVPTGTSDYKELVKIKGATSGWVGETGNRAKTDTPVLREVSPSYGELYAYPQVSEWSLDDMFFNVEEWLAEEVAEDFAVQEGEAVISGNGTNKPIGMINTAPVTKEDGAAVLRPAGAYQFIPSDTSPGAATTPEPGILPDSLIDLTFAVNSKYRYNAHFVFNSVTAGSIRKLKDQDGQYLWQAGLQMGQPDTLLGYPYEIWEQMPDVGLNKHPVSFGNFRRAYLLTPRTGMRITRDDVTNVGFVRFYVRRREGGNVLNNNAVKFLKTV